MSQLNAYLTALLPDPTRVLAHSLKPFSLGHLNLIERTGCASFINGFQATPESIVQYTRDFLACVLICAMTYEEAKEAFEADVITLRHRTNNADGTYTETYSKASFSDYVERWIKEVEEGCTSKSINMLLEMSAMQKYVKDAFAGPETYELREDSSKSFKSGAPWEQGLRDFLLTKHSESEAMNMPLALAFWEWNKEAENNRQIAIKSEDDVSAIEMLKAMK